MDSISFEKLRDIEARYEALGGRMSDPAVAQDPPQYQKLARRVQGDRPHRGALPLLQGHPGRDQQGPGDGPLGVRPRAAWEMAHEELRALEARRDGLDVEIPLLLVPKDPNDERNVFVEIRAGTGGDEASLFAAEIMRMYVRYAESKRWKCDVTDANYSSVRRHQGRDAPDRRQTRSTRS